MCMCLKSKELENHTTSEASPFAIRAAPAMLSRLLDVLILDYLLRLDRHVHHVVPLNVKLALLECGFIVEHAAEEDESDVGG